MSSIELFVYGISVCVRQNGGVRVRADMPSIPESERIKLAISFAVEAPFVLFHIAVTICIVHGIVRKKPAFKSAFFTIYVTLSVVDVVAYINCSIHTRFVPLLMPSSFVLTPLAQAIFYTTAYTNSFQFTAHTMIALNRYTAFLHPATHKQIWSGRRLGTAILTLFTVPVVVNAFGLVNAIGCVRMSGQAVTSWTPPFAFAANCFMLAAYAVITSALCGYLEIRTFLVYRRMNAKMKFERRHEFRLLLYAITQFVAQMLMTALGLLPVLSYLTDKPEFVFAAMAWFSYAVDVLSLTGPICLFITCQQVRESFFQLYSRRGPTPTTTVVISLTKV